MAKYCGEIGYGVQVQKSKGVYVDEIVIRKYYGDIVRNVRKLEKSEQLNDNINVSNQISIVADAYACENFFAIKFATWMGVRWKVTNVEVQHPRLLLTLGGIYNGPEGESA